MSDDWEPTDYKTTAPLRFGGASIVKGVDHRTEGKAVILLLKVWAELSDNASPETPSPPEEFPEIEILLSPEDAQTLGQGLYDAGIETAGVTH